MEIEDLLRRASAAPLGPLVFTYKSSGPDAWTLTVTLGDKTREVRAERDTATEGLVLACKIDKEASTAFDGSWVSDTTNDEINGQTERRLWLHGDGLSSALLLNALATLVPVGAATPGTPAGLIVETARIIIPPPPEEPKPVLVERPRPVGWNSFGFGRRETPQPEPEPAAVTESSEPGVEPVTDTGLAVEHEAKAAGEGLAQTEAEAVPIGVESGPEPTVLATDPTSQPAEPAVETVQAAGKAGYCRECGSPYQPDHAFCTNCGAKLN